MAKKTAPKKDKQKTEKSPSNPRVIPDKEYLKSLGKEWKVVLFSFTVGIFVMGILFLAVDSLRLLDELEMKKQERVTLQEEIEEWESVVSLYPDYRDGYFKLALLYYQSGDKENVYKNIAKVESLDPQFERTAELKEAISEGM